MSFSERVKLHATRQPLFEGSKQQKENSNIEFKWKNTY